MLSDTHIRVISGPKNPSSDIEIFMLSLNWNIEKLSENDEDCFVVYDGGSIQVLCDLF